MQVINKSNFVKTMLKGLELRTIIESGICFIAILWMTYGISGSESVLYLYFVGAIVFVVFGYLLQEKITKAKIWRSGLTGQNMVEAVLSDLSDQFYLINNLSLPFKNCDIDHLLIGPNGVFLLETKHYKGEISCVGDSWVYQKVGKNGGTYRGYINNPSRQLKRNVWELKTFLDKKSKKLFGDRQFPFWIQGIVVFTNDEAVLHAKEETVKILKLNALLPYIREFRNMQISPENVKNIVKLFSEL